MNLPDPEPAWQDQLGTLLRERDARRREAQAEPVPADDAALSAIRRVIADWLSEHGRQAIRTLDNLMTRHGAGYRLAAEPDLGAGTLTLRLTQGAILLMTYTLALNVLPDRVTPLVTVRHGAEGRPQTHVLPARLAGADLDTLTADDLCADVVAALAEAGA